MSPASWAKHGIGKLGTGYGQRYVTRDGKTYVKVEG
jgi:hypothetical protein